MLCQVALWLAVFGQNVPTSAPQARETSSPPTGIQAAVATRLLPVGAVLSSLHRPGCEGTRCIDGVKGGEILFGCGESSLSLCYSGRGSSSAWLRVDMGLEVRVDCIVLYNPKAPDLYPEQGIDRRLGVHEIYAGNNGSSPTSNRRCTW
eukprot:Hpha_TRINITY_DN27463_c0_g1::TRINITY_DN27463_c0_g1_i1::g.193892::m.193892